jgi:hypothetical protein
MFNCMPWNSAGDARCGGGYVSAPRQIIYTGSRKVLRVKY